MTAYIDCLLWEDNLKVTCGLTAYRLGCPVYNTVEQWRGLHLTLVNLALLLVLFEYKIKLISKQNSQIVRQRYTLCTFTNRNGLLQCNLLSVTSQYFNNITDLTNAQTNDYDEDITDIHWKTIYARGMLTLSQANLFWWRRNNFLQPGLWLYPRQ